MENNAEQGDDTKSIRTQKYIVEITHYEDGSKRMRRTNDGFDPLELIGLCDFVAMEVRDTIRGMIKPDVIKREVIK